MAQPVGGGGSRGSVMATMTVATLVAARPRGVLRRAVVRAGKAEGMMGAVPKMERQAEPGGVLLAVGSSWLATNDDGGGNVGSTRFLNCMCFKKPPLCVFGAGTMGPHVQVLSFFFHFQALFSSKNFCKIEIVTLSFVFDKYCPIIN